MKPGLSELDSEPWYRQFWPWFLISLPASVVIAGLFTLYIAIRGSDDLVVDDYYKDGLAINRQLEKQRRSAELGIEAALNIDHGAVTVQVSGPVQAAGLVLLLSHPMEADRDFTLSLPRIAPGLYQGVLPAAVAPRWHWTLRDDGEQDWRLDGRITERDVRTVAGE